MTGWFANSEWYSWAASIGGAIWGVSLQTDFGTITLKTKLWRGFLAVVLASCIGPGLLHMYFDGAATAINTAIMFGLSLGSLTVVPIVMRRVQLLAKTGKLWGLPEDKQ